MTDRKKVTLPYLFNKVANHEPITWLTCYDYPTAYLNGTSRHGHDPGGRQPGNDHAGL